MHKVRIFIFIVFITCSVSSVAYATPTVPTATNEIGLQYDLTDTDRFEEMDIYSGDALNWVTIKQKQSEDTGDVVYTVVKGDNLYRIALAHDISVESLKSMNNLTSDLIYPGDELKIVGDELNGSTVAKAQDKAVAKPKVASAPKKEQKTAVAAHPPTGGGKEMIMTATAYTAYCNGCSGTTAYGMDLRANPNQKVIAVDPRVIPLGTRVWVEGYGEAIAGDTGGAIKGNKIDVFIPSHESAIAWGVKTVKIRVLN